MADIVGETDNIGRRYRGGAPDGEARLGRPRCSPSRPRRRWSSSATSLLAWSRRRSSPRRATTSSPSRPSRTPRRPVIGGGDHVRQVQGQPGRGRVPRVPDDPGGRGELGRARRVLVAEQEHRHERVPGRDHADDGGRVRRGGELPLRPLRPAALGVRRDRRAGPVQGSSQDFVANPEDIDGITQQMEAAAAKAYG